MRTVSPSALGQSLGSGRSQGLASRRIWALLLWIGLGLASTDLSAQARTPDDSLAARVQACTGCHGPQGRATPDGYLPRIAGKPAGYLFNQLRHFRDGRRNAASMTWMVDLLPDAYLREIAGHFAQQHPPYPPPMPVAVGRDVLERGLALARVGDPSRKLPSCISCHGQDLLGVQPAIPGLLGLPRDYLNAQFGAWRNGTRRAQAPDCMAEVTRRMAPDDVAAVTAWLASQPVPTDARAQVLVSQNRPLDCGGLEP